MKPMVDKQGRSVKTVVILFSITILYFFYRYQGSSGFFLVHFNKSMAYRGAQALSMYYQWGMALILLGIIPGLIVRLVLKERLKNYGVKLSNPLLALFITLLGVVFVTPFIYFGARNPKIAAVYPLVENASESPLLFLKSSVFYFLYYIGYEFCFRGFLFMGIRDDIGQPQAMAVSLIATVLLHVSQPQEEMAMSILAGIAFPLMVNWLNTLWPVIVIHAYTGISLDYWIILHSGGFR